MVEIPLFNSFYKNPILLDLFKKDSNLSPFHNGTDLSHIDHDFLKKRDLSIENREVLYQVISSQYSKTGLKIPENLKAIKNKGVFTIFPFNLLAASRIVSNDTLFSIIYFILK